MTSSAFSIPCEKRPIWANPVLANLFLDLVCVMVGQRAEPKPRKSRCLSLCVFSWFFGGVWKRGGRQMFTFGVLGLSCEAPVPKPRSQVVWVMASFWDHKSEKDKKERNLRRERKRAKFWTVPQKVVRRKGVRNPAQGGPNQQPHHQHEPQPQQQTTTTHTTTTQNNTNTHTNNNPHQHQPQHNTRDWPKMDWPKLAGKTRWPKMDWPKLDWPKSALPEM